MQIKNLCSKMLLLCFCFLSFNVVAQEAENYAANTLVIKFKAGYTPVYSVKSEVALFGIPAVDALNNKYHCTAARRINAGRKSKIVSYTYVLQFAGDVSVSRLVKAYSKTGCLQYAEPDYKGSVGGATSTVPNDADFGDQWSLHNNGSFPHDSAIAGADIKMEQAWDIEKGDSIIVVAVLDAGVKMDHPEFAGRIWKNYGEIPGNNLDDDGNGYIDDVQGWDMANVDNDATDDHGHGTNVAGIIGATGNNGVGFAGMDWHCKIMALKVLVSNGTGQYTWWAEAITYATDNGAKVINMSLGGNNASQVLQDAITYAHTNGVTVVVAMGNGNGSAPSYPAACDHVIAVGATNAHDVRVTPFSWGGGSNYGPNISVVAPGDYIYGLDYTSNNNFGTYWSGTSQATPHVAGLVALLLAQDTSRTPDQLKHIVEVTADDLVGSPAEDVTGWDQYYGHGRINAYRALTYNPAKTQNVTYNNSGVEIFPNPATGKINIHVASANEPVQYSVTSITGVLVVNGSFTGNNSQIDLSRQPKGTYIIRLNNKNINYVQKEILE